MPTKTVDKVYTLAAALALLVSMTVLLLLTDTEPANAPDEPLPTLDCCTVLA